MEFEITEDQLHSTECGAFSKPQRGGGGRSRHKTGASFIAHISQQQDAQYSPLRQVTTKIHELYKRCNPAFSRSTTSVPPRVLTQPSDPLSDAVPYDNKEGNLIARVFDQIHVPGQNYHYTIMDLLGTGTFGQVFRCLKEVNAPNGEDNVAKTPSEVVAVKVVKGKPAYRTQGLLEVKIAKVVNRLGDPDDRHNLVRVLDSFEDRGHVCIVFELLSCSLLDILTQNQFRGLPLEVVQRFTVQLLAALVVLQDTNIIHCDLKPENILLCSKNNNGGISKIPSVGLSGEERQGQASPSPPTTQRGAVDIKVIDFGSACFEGKTMYSYIQSRFYRSPEVLLGVPYNGAIDIWSLGCVCAEMYLGLPLFPGASQHNQLTRITDMLGEIPSFLVEHGKNRDKFFISLKPPSPPPTMSLLPLPFSLPPPLPQSHHIGGTGCNVKASSSLGSILPAALIEGGTQVSSFMNTLVSNNSSAENPCEHTNKLEDNMNLNTRKNQNKGGNNFRLKTAEEYASDNHLKVPNFRKYLRYDKLDDIVMKCPLPSGTSGHMSTEQKKKEHYRRKCFLDFLKGLLNLNPFDRLTARQAMEHPFVAKYFNKKSNIGTIKVKAVVPSPSSPTRNTRNFRRSNSSDSATKTSTSNSELTPEYVEKRIFLPSYDDKVKTRLESYQNKMEEILSCAVPATHVMGRHNVYLTTQNVTESTVSAVSSHASVSEQDKNTVSPSVIESVDKISLQQENKTEKSTSSGIASHAPTPGSMPLPNPAHPHMKPPDLIPAHSGNSNKNVSSANIGVSPGGLISALLQSAPIQPLTGNSSLQQDQPLQNPHHHNQMPAQHYMLPPPPPSSLASSYGSPLGGSFQGLMPSSSSSQSSSLPIPMPQPIGDLNDLQNGKITGSPYFESPARHRVSGSAIGRSSNSAMGTSGRVGSGVGGVSGSYNDSLSGSLNSTNVFNSGSSFDFGNFLGSVSGGSSLSSNPPSFPNSNANTPLQQHPLQSYSGPSGFTPSNSLNGPGGAYMYGSPATSGGDYGQSLQRPELDESRYLQSFGFQFQQQPQIAHQNRKGFNDRRHSISESSYQYQPGRVDDVDQNKYNKGVNLNGTIITSSSFGKQSGTSANDSPYIQSSSFDSCSWNMPPPNMDNPGHFPIAAALSIGVNSTFPGGIDQKLNGSDGVCDKKSHQHQPNVKSTSNQSSQSDGNLVEIDDSHSQVRHSITSNSSSEDEPIFECDD